MTWRITADPNRFDEALEWFRGKIPTLSEIKESLDELARDRAFTIAGVAQLDVVQEIHSLIIQAIESGTSFQDFQSFATAALTERWSSDRPGRVQLIYRNATQSAYNAGRWRQITSPEVAAIRPYALFDGIGDIRQTEICEACNGTILPLTDPWWASHNPPLHHNCRSSIRSLTEAQARRRGISELAPTVDAQATFGRPATEGDWQPVAADYDATLFSIYADKQRRLREAPEPTNMMSLTYMLGAEPSARHKAAFEAWDQSVGYDRFGFEARSKDDLEINVLDVIGIDPRTGTGITSSAFKAVLDQFPDARNIRTVINSPGGHAYEGVAIHSLLRRHGARITTEIVGVAASAASIIAMAGDKIEMHIGSEIMVHRASGLTFGNWRTHEKMSSVLKDLDSGLLDIYADRTGIAKATLETMLDDETWLSTDRALALGFATKVLQRTKPAPAYEPPEDDENPTNVGRVEDLLAIAEYIQRSA